MVHSSLTPNRLLRVLLILAVTLLGLRLLVTSILPAFRSGGGDFANFYTASRLLAEGQSLAPAYASFPWFQKQMDRFGLEDQLGGFIPHSPAAALLFMPLADLDPLPARRLWTILNVFFLLASIFLLARVAAIDLLPAALILLLTGPGLLNQFLFGQLYLLLLVSILAGLWLADLRCPRLAGACFGLLAPVKYVGLLWIVYFGWRKRWKLVLSSLLAIAVLVALAFWLAGEDSFRVFLIRVLPRHLNGEIQDPFAVRFQSWGSLWRRLFIADPGLNPNPLWPQPVMYFIFRNLASFGLLGLTLWLLAGVNFLDRRHSSLFCRGWLALFPLLTAPGAATYHFLLLAITAACFTRILLDQGRTGLAWGMILFFGLLNLPHYLWLEDLAEGWTTPLAYSRLGLLAIYGGVAILAFRPALVPRGFPWPGFMGLALLAVVATGLGIRGYRPPTSDGAERAAPGAGEFAEEAGLIQFAPATGKQRWIFSSMERNPDGYAIFDDRGQRWPLPRGRNYYRGDLAPDDQRLLVESIRGGISRILLSSGNPDQAIPLADGEAPCWSPDGSAFLFLREGRIHWRSMPEGTRERSLPLSAPVSEAVFLDPLSIVFVSRNAKGSRLGVFSLDTGKETTLLSSESTLSSPGSAANGRGLLFVWDRAGNRDVWAMDLLDRSLHQVTSHPGNDEDPVWVEPAKRILFVSDRGRGLAYSTLFWIHPPGFLERTR